MLSAPTTERQQPDAELEERAGSDRTSDRDWQKASLFGGVFARLSLVRKDLVKDSLMTPLPSKLPPPVAALRIQRAERGRATRKRAHETLNKARNKVTASRAQPEPEAAPSAAPTTEVSKRAADVEKQSVADVEDQSAGVQGRGRPRKDVQDESAGDPPSWLPLVLGSVALIGLVAAIALVVHITNNPEQFFART